MNERDATVVREFKRRIPTDLKASVARLIVYGSRARGDAAEDSDLDVLALVTPDQPDIETRLEDIAYAVMWDFDFQPLLSLKVMPETRFRAALEKGHSFQRHVMAEGVVV